MKLKKLGIVLATTMLSVAMLVGCGGQTGTTNESAAVKESAVEKESEKAEKSEAKTPDDALALLKSGNQRFVDNKLANNDLGEMRRKELAEGQEPFAVVVTCSDSRVVPEHVFDQGLGDIFVIRVAGNILDKAEIGSVEYAVDHLGSKVVVILGHESCGAVTTAVAKVEKPADTQTTENIDAFLDNIEPAVVKAKETKLEGKELVEKTADINVEMAADQLAADSALVKKAVDESKVKIVGAKYHLSSGEISWQK